jgi:hypothetical protein
MLEGLVDGLIRGDRLPWAIIGALWLLTAGLSLARRSGARAGPAWGIALLAVASVASLAALPLAEALSVPRVRWKAAEAPAVVAPSGDGWRRLRGPAVLAIVDGAPDVAVPGIDAVGAWVLHGLISGRPVPGLEPASPGPVEPGAARICPPAGEACRPWPRAWPDPSRALPLDDLAWSKHGLRGALAYDVESGLALTRMEGADGSTRAPDDPRPLIDLAGRLTNGPSRSGTTTLFVIRRVAFGRLGGVRVVAVPAADGAHAFHFQRADVSLLAGPRVFRTFARPILLASSLALPLGLLAYLLAPLLLRASLRRRGATLRELSRELAALPLDGDRAASLPHPGAGRSLAAVADDADLGDALLPRGAVVSLAFGAPGAALVTSRAWFELPSAAEEQGSAILHDERGRSRKVGPLVPADAGPFRRAAAAWMGRYVVAAAVFAAGIAMAAPAVAAMVELAASR